MSPNLNYKAVQAYWDSAGEADAANAVYIGDEQGLPGDCLRYRFKMEWAAVERWLTGVLSTANVLDLACGSGVWCEKFARRFRRVVGVERSATMIESARRSVKLANVDFVQADALEFNSEEQFDVIFLGSLLMYLNREDAVSLLRSLAGRLTSGGRVIVKDTTLRSGEETLVGDYQVSYRAVAEYRAIVAEAGLTVTATEQNRGYERMEVAKRIINTVRSLPLLRSTKPAMVGVPIWWALRATAPASLVLFPRAADKLGLEWPHLQNHFLLLHNAH